MADLPPDTASSAPRVGLRPSRCIKESGLSKTTFWRRVHAGKIPAYRDGDCIIIYSDDWAEYLAKRPQAAA
jgi:hypothetical protein